jgi:hypothetical protein
MKRAIILTAILCVCLISGIAHAVEGSWEIISRPSTGSTSANAIDGDNIAGEYHRNIGNRYYSWQGFCSDGTNWTTISPPGTENINVKIEGIDGLNVVGSYMQDHHHGFIYDGASYTILDAPGATATQARGINGINIVGDYTDSSGTHAFLYNGTNWTTLNAVGSNATYAHDIDGDNIVGTYWDGNHNAHGFLFDGTNWTTLDVPGAVRTKAYGISGNNIVGYYDDGKYQHGFLYDGISYTTLDIPGELSTYLYDIDGDRIVGQGTISSNSFVYTISEPTVIKVAIDIKPDSCPNHLNVNSKGNGVLRVAILGSAEFDVFSLDIATITLEGVAPVRSGFEDVATRFDGEECECSTEGPDGFPDLTLKFKRRDILTALQVTYGDLTEIANTTDIPLTLKAMLIDEEVELEGTDCIRLLNNGKRVKAVKKKK